VLILVMAFRGGAVPQDPAAPVTVMTTATNLKLLPVVVALESVSAGESFDRVKLAVESRPESTLPADRIASLDLLKNKVAAGPIPAGNPLSLAFVADNGLAPVAEALGAFSARLDPTDALLSEIENDTVAVPVTFLSVAPQRGSRVAVTLSRSRGESTLLVEECWVAKASGRDAVLRIEPSKALLLQYARALGNLGFIELPLSGPSPYAGKGVRSEDELRRIVDDAPRTARSVSDDSPAPSSPRKLKGYAWVTGESVRYHVDDDGRIKVDTGE
jgi:hypothetical protein